MKLKTLENILKKVTKNDDIYIGVVKEDANYFYVMFSCIIYKETYAISKEDAKNYKAIIERLRMKFLYKANRIRVGMRQAARPERAELFVR